MPRVLVATMADGVLAAHGQKFFVLGGGFDNFKVNAFPAIFPRISLLLALEIEAGTDVPVACRIVLRSKANSQEIFAVELKFVRNGSFDHPTIAWQGLNLPPVSFAGPGTVILEASAGESQFASQFEVIGPQKPIFPVPGGSATYNN
jgi:hypothetical protein